MTIAINKAAKRYGAKKLARKNVQKFTLAAQRKREEALANREIADLEWQVKFTKMKLGLWRDLDKNNWTILEDMHKTAQRKLKQEKQQYFG